MTLFILTKNLTDFDPPMKKSHNQMDTSIHTAYSTFFVHSRVCSFSFLSFSSQISNFCRNLLNKKLITLFLFLPKTHLEKDFGSFFGGNENQQICFWYLLSFSWLYILFFQAHNLESANLKLDELFTIYPIFQLS